MLSALGLALSGLSSCDPALRMVLRNSTSQPIQLTTVHLRPGQSDTTRQQVLPPGERVTYLGIGGWSDSTIQRVVRSTKHWEVVRPGDTLRLQGPLLADFLGRCPRKGYGQSKLLVDFK